MATSKFYTIRQTTSFYGPSSIHDFVFDEANARPIIFEGRVAAKSWIEARNAERYYQDHNEYGRPDYRIIPARRIDDYFGHSGYAKKYPT